jgi:ADP-ribosyl-[dinitrogen reductase] hydrolase
MPSEKTSQSHPLRIDPVLTRDGRGTIGLTFCPGKHHTGNQGNWRRDLRLDLQSIRDFGAVALITLMEEWELEKYQAPLASLSAQAAEAGLAWYHLPIKDVSVPDERFESLWPDTGSKLRNILSSGGSIVIHCLGGLGRTGTIAGRLLVELGDDPEVAIRKIRTARPDSIETPAQERYVRSCKACGSKI